MNTLPYPSAVLYAGHTSGAAALFPAAAKTGCPAALPADFSSSQTAKAAMPRRCPTNINPKVAERNIGAASGARRRRVPAPIYPRVLAAAHLLGRRRAWLADALGLGLLAAAAVLVYLTF